VVAGRVGTEFDITNHRNCNTAIVAFADNYLEVPFKHGFQSRRNFFLGQLLNLNFSRRQTMEAGTYAESVEV
jgi:Uma2 family endonuclease